MMSIGFANFRGGVGKTTIAFSTILSMAQLKPAEKEKKYIFVEADFGSNAATRIWDPNFEMEKFRTLSDYLKGKCEVDEIAYVSDRYPIYREIAFIPSGKLNIEETSSIKETNNLLNKMRELKEFLASRAEKVVIDYPGGGGLNHLENYFLLFTVTDEIVPVIQPDPPSIEAADKLINFALLSGVKYRMVVVNKYSKKFKKLLKVSEEKLAVNGQEIKIFTVNKDEQVPLHWSKLIPVVVKKNRVRKDIEKIAAFLLDLENGTETKSQEQTVESSLKLKTNKLKKIFYILKNKAIFLGREKRSKEEIFKELEAWLEENETA